MSIVGADPIAPAPVRDDLRALDALPRIELKTAPHEARATSTPVNGHGYRRTSEQTQVAEDFADPADDFEMEPSFVPDELPSTDDDARRELDATWIQSLRFARSATWALPVGAFGFALASLWGWPTPTGGPAGLSPAGWLATMLVSLALALLGAVALAALLGATSGRRPAAAALVAMISGTVVFVPVLGLVGIARPAIARLPAQIRPQVAGSLDGWLLDGGVVRWLSVGGLGLLGAGWFLMGCAVLASGILNRTDGVLLIAAVSVAGAAAYQSWQFLLVIAAMIMVAGGLGLAWTAWRLAPDGQVPED
jgi:Amt family ammonium transporter